MKAQLTSPTTHQGLGREEAIDIFVKTLTDIYDVKTHLLINLPLMSKRANTRSLRLAILDTSIDVYSQLLRMDMMMAILKQESKKQIEVAIGDLNLDHYIKSTLMKAESYKTDIALITHLLMVEGLQIITFSIMVQMSRSFHNATVNDLINQNLVDSENNKKVLDSLLRTYLSNNKH